MQTDSRAAVAATRRAVVRIAGAYTLLVALWIFIESGIPFSLFLDAKVDPATWEQTLNGWFFIIASGWLLYLLVSKTLRTMADAEQGLRLRDRAIESSINGVFIIDHIAPGRPVIYANPAFERITGYSRSDTLGHEPWFLQESEENRVELQAVRLALKEQHACRTTLRGRRKDGSLVWNELNLAPVRDESGQVSHYAGILNDITDAKNYEQELAHQANYDSLTGLANRNLLADRIAGACARAERYSTIAAVVLINLDNFKLINDTLGHSAGDAVLRSIARRLEKDLRASDTLARLGGDTFVIVLNDQAGEDSVSVQMKRVLDMLAQPFTIASQDVFITASMGVALFPQDARDAESLVKSAELAMYRGREEGRGGFRLFTAEMNARVTERLSLESKLRRALEREELTLHYQAQVDLRTNRVCAAEALIRWNEPELGTVSPARFIPLAEETGLIIPIGEWALKTACRQNRAWRTAGLPPIVVAVNVSAPQFHDPALIGVVQRILDETGIAHDGLELEVTESVMLHGAERTIETLQALKAMGIQLSIDDFGTGYSSLGYLKRFPVDRLKIDQSFVRDIATNPDDAAIVQAVISLGHAMQLRVIAEGVESVEQLEFLRRQQCDETQGYLFSKPLPAEEFARLLSEGRMLAA